MPQGGAQEADERTHLLSHLSQGNEANDNLGDRIHKRAAAPNGTAGGQYVPYGDYAAIDWLRDLVK